MNNGPHAARMVVQNDTLTENPPIISSPRFDQSATNAHHGGSTIETKSSIDHRAVDIDDEQILGSTWSYSSTRDLSGLTQESFGRIFNTLNDVYLLPTDETEWARLDKQHSALLMGLSNLYACPDIVSAVLAPTPGDTKRVLDIGCGTGSWAIEVARRFPHVAVKGVDVAPTPLDVTYFPPNLSFEIDDINHGLTHFYSQYDFVHMRLVRAGITNFGFIMHELQMCLKPGGLLLIVEADVAFENEHHRKVTMAKIGGDEDVSGVCEGGCLDVRIHWESMKCCEIRGSDLDRALEIVDLGLWDYEMLDSDTAGGGFISLPIGPWAQSPDPVMNEKLRYCGILTGQVCKNLHRTFHAALRQFGMSKERLEEWSRQIDTELETMCFRTLLRYPFCWARKREAPGLPAPPLPATPLVQGENNPITEDEFPFLKFYSSAEEAATWRQQRVDSQGILPTSR